MRTFEELKGNCIRFFYDGEEYRTLSQPKLSQDGLTYKCSVLDENEKIAEVTWDAKYIDRKLVEDGGNDTDYIYDSPEKLEYI